MVVAAVLTAAAAASPTQDAEVTMPGKLFAPRGLDVLVGTTVTWRNVDTSTHTVTEEDDAFDSGMLRPGNAFSHAFREQGTFTYQCRIHRFMRGEVRVFQIVLRGPEERILAGRRARLDGVAPSGAAEVVLERVAKGTVDVVGRAIPGPDGTFTFHVRAPAPVAYRARAGTASSPLVPLQVAPRVAVERRAAGIAVVARPSRAGSRVAIQEYDRERFAFVTVARGRLDASSRTIVAYSPSRVAHVRVVVLGREGWSDGVSRSLLVSPASN